MKIITVITFSVILVIALLTSLLWLALIVIAKEKPKVKEVLRAFENGITLIACVLLVICLILKFV